MLRLSFQYFRGLYFGLLFLIVVITVGSVGYMFIEDYTFNEGFYMTLITVSTVGFGEVRPLSDEGRLFTSFLILSSFGTFAYAATSVASNVLSGDYKYFFKNYKLIQEISNMQGHTIVCGYGNNGEAAANFLSLHNQPFIVIEKDPSKLEKAKDQNTFPFIEGDATDDSLFIQAGIKSAKSLISALPSDADNVFVCLSARQLNPKLTIISRATDIKSEPKLKLAGANNVIMPDRVGGSHMASLVTTPDINEFLDLLSITNPHSVNLEEIWINKIEGLVNVKSIVQSMDMKVRVIGIKKKDNEYIVSPDMEAEVSEGEKLFVLGDREHISKLSSRFA